MAATEAPFLLAIMGPTASGKTELAEGLAERHNAQLINADAFQVYRGMDIGTGKPEHKEIYKLLDLVDPDQEFGLGKWIQLAAKVLVQLWGEGRSAIVVGGTGLYIRALMEDYVEMSHRPNEQLRKDLMAEEERLGLAALAERLVKLNPEAAERVDLKNPVRVRRALEKALYPSEKVRIDLPPFRREKIGLNPPVAELEQRIRSRIDRMFEQGWASEVRNLLQAGYTTSMPGFRAIGYKQVAAMLNGETSEEEAKQSIFLATRQYAKRQRTWMRREPAVRSLPEDIRSAPS